MKLVLLICQSKKPVGFYVALLQSRVTSDAITFASAHSLYDSLGFRHLHDARLRGRKMLETEARLLSLEPWQIWLLVLKGVVNGDTLALFLLRRGEKLVIPWIKRWSRTTTRQRPQGEESSLAASQPLASFCCDNWFCSEWYYSVL